MVAVVSEQAKDDAEASPLSESSSGDADALKSDPLHAPVFAEVHDVNDPPEKVLFARIGVCVTTVTAQAIYCE
jgi:hypothetical protein